DGGAHPVRPRSVRAERVSARNTSNRCSARGSRPPVYLDVDPGGRRASMGAQATAARHLSDEEDRLMRQPYAEHAQPLHRYVLKLVSGDSHRAEDVVQETLTRAWRNVATLETDTQTLRPWLVTVARRLVIDDYRGRLSRPREVDATPLEFVAAADELDDAM